MVHNHYLEEAKKKTQESSRNLKPSVMPSARSQSTANGSKPKPKINNQKSRNWPASKSSCSKGYRVYNKRTRLIVESIHLRFDEFKEMSMTSVHNSSGLAPPRQMTSDHNSSELEIHDHSNELSSSKLVPKVVPPADKTATSRQELELLFHHHITMLRLELPQELSRVHHTFHVSNLKKCYADEPLVMPLEGIHVDDKLQFVEEPVEIMEREIKRLKRSRIPLVKIVQLILFIVDSGCTKHMTGNVSLLCNFVEKYLGTVRFGNDQFAPILGYGDLVQGNITIKRVYYVREFDEIKEMSETSVANDTSGLVPQRQKASDYDKPDPAPELQNVYPSADTTVPSQQELYLLFGPLYDEFFNDGTSRINKSSSPTDNSVPQDTHPSTNIQTTSEPSTTTNAHG
ncbi:hypothetical protein Tco_0273440 [Tanacetum coccineum]